MLINFLVTFIRKEAPKFLGRWNLEECLIKRNNKIDWANVDHCGTCSLKKNSQPHPQPQPKSQKPQANVTQPLS